MSTIPLGCVEPNNASSVGRHSWCAGHKVGVGTVRVETTFLWMSDSNSGSIGRSNRMAISSILLTNDLVNRSVV